MNENLFFYIMNKQINMTLTKLKIDLIFNELIKENKDFVLIDNCFDFVVGRFGLIYDRYKQQTPFKKGYEQLIKILQLKMKHYNIKHNVDINIHDYIPKMKSMYIIQLI